MANPVNDYYAYPQEEMYPGGQYDKQYYDADPGEYTGNQVETGSPPLRYDTNMHGVGKPLQKFSSRAAQIGLPFVSTPFSQIAEQIPQCSPCCPQRQSHLPGTGPPWEWTKQGKLKLSCQQPVVPVPIIQEIHRRDRLIEIPKIELIDAVQPKIYNQDVEHQVPTMEINVDEKEVAIPTLRYVDREVIVPIVTGYTHKFVPKWEIREVPRPVVKYVGEQEIIEIDVPKIKFVDKIVEKQVVVDTIQKKVPLVTEIPKYVETVKYVWKPVEKIVYVEKVVPKFDVSLDCPAPLLIPYAVKSVKELPSIMVRKEVGELEQREVTVDVPPGTIRVPDEYIREYTKKESSFIKDCLSVCDCTNTSNVVAEDAIVHLREIQQTNSDLAESELFRNYMDPGDTESLTESKKTKSERGQSLSESVADI
ncbi:alveolin domain containing intermediate filament IMC6 [Cardiosporidium cionae]|uniref:Alveolin domain containing intermediate filament IMC6 n=1 Tax=Cardiosporidium cionae TaxID=476202 RepID=A0ABQ7J9K6_9APIC|nr:alveolin domain containing intermediate filament IMC6 [Cardiosporidium cionae]|eukprot:KAF8820638.1 alveolin domain containing intermediate filament IMC6 [Cardiosporidium cionae]